MNTAMGIRLMDRRVKERLIGATILVVLIVLIVPEMLSGPRRPRRRRRSPPACRSDRSVSVDLATSKATTQPDAARLPAAARRLPARWRQARGSSRNGARAQRRGRSDAGGAESAPPEHGAPGAPRPRSRRCKRRIRAGG